jgi:hypothetical protein
LDAGTLAFFGTDLRGFWIWKATVEFENSVSFETKQTNTIAIELHRFEEGVAAANTLITIYCITLLFGIMSVPIVPTLDLSTLSVAEQLGPTPNVSPNSTALFQANKATIFASVQAFFGTQVQQVPPPAVQAQPTGIRNPRVGGTTAFGNQVIAWTGGKLVTSPTTGAVTNILREPSGPNAYRPNNSDLSQLLKIQKACTSGLPESQQLPMPGASTSKEMTKEIASTVTIVSWQREIDAALKERGMDAVFRAQINGQEVYLLERWGEVTPTNIRAHLAWMNQHGDEYDKQNLSWSAKFIMNSLSAEMAKRVKQELPNTLTNDYTGPDVFCAVIALHTVVNDSTQRMYIAQLESLKLTKEPGEDVSVLADKVVGIARTIVGLSPMPPSDLHTLVYQCFAGCSTPTFATDVSNLLSKCFRNDQTVRNWETEVTALMSMYRDLKQRNQWVALMNMKEKTEAVGMIGGVDVKAMQSTITRLEKQVKEVKEGKSNSSKSNGKTNKELTCYWCGEKGHAKPSCPNLDKPKKYKGEEGKAKTNNSNSNANTNQSSTASTSGTSTKKWKAPATGESHTKTEEGSVYKWCGTCKKWNKGDKAHLTDEHVKKSSTTAVANMAQADVQTQLSFVAGYFGGAVNSAKHTYQAPPSPEQTKEANTYGPNDNWSFINWDGCVCCKYCCVEVPPDQVDCHLSDDDHFQEWLRVSMPGDVSEEAMEEFMPAFLSEEEIEKFDMELREMEGWETVKSKREKKEKRLKVRTGQS